MLRSVRTSWGGAVRTYNQGPHTGGPQQSQGPQGGTSTDSKDNSDSSEQQQQGSAGSGGAGATHSQGSGSAGPSQEQQPQQDQTSSSDTHFPYRVQPGDCISSISKRYGMHWETVWNDPENQGLKDKRQDPNVLFPGDIVQIRKNETKQEPCAPEEIHRFRALGQPSMLRLRLMNPDETPRANEKYKLTCGEREFEGTTDPEGKLEHPVPNLAKKAILCVGNDPKAQDQFELKIGQIDPIAEVRGAQQRLNNLGFDPGPIDGIMGPKTQAGIKAFQKREEMDETGQLDQETAAKLVEEHGC